MHMNSHSIRRIAAAALLALNLATAQAQSEASAVSALSALPIAISLAAPALVLSAGVSLTVVAVQASALGTVWILERASDGARITLRLSAQAAAGLSAAAGTVVTVSVIGTGWVLSVAGEALAMIPNEIGAALLYNERISR
jgi:hypothetical protein